MQGYKFNIFYADLVDKIQTPRYDVVPDRINGEKCIIKFHAEPPYEDAVRWLDPEEYFGMYFESGLITHTLVFQMTGILNC